VHSDNTDHISAGRDPGAAAPARPGGTRGTPCLRRHVYWRRRLHVAIVVTGTETYRHFADTAFILFVKQAWLSVFMPHAALLGLLLAAFELAVGLLILAGARKTVLGLVAAVAFHLGLMLFGWGFWFWSIPMLAMLVALLRYDFDNALGPRRNQRTEMRT
jgi:hypothetical protein